MRKTLLGSVSLFVMTCYVGTAEAQQAAPSDSSGIEEIVVTAQKRANTVQKSALAIAVLGSDQLSNAGVADPKDLNGLVPGLTIAQRGSNTQVYVRGIGDNSATGLAVAAVAVNVDGVYIDRPTAVGSNFYDLERVEVLKGPQGTLYGRNASGGAVNLITNQPSQTFGGYLDLTGGNYGLFKAAGAVNVPVTDQLAVRAAFQTVNRDGYLSDGYNDQVSQAGRVQALWEPNSDVSVKLSADIAHIGGHGAGTVLLPSPGGNPWEGPSDPANQAIVAASANKLLGPAIGPQTLTAKNNGFMNNQTRNISGELNWNMGWATLTVVPAYRNMNLEYLTYEPGYYFSDKEHSDQYTLETRLANQTDAFKWTVGGFFFHEDQSIGQLVFANPLVFASDVPISSLPTQSYAFFGEGTYSVTPDLRLTGGLRYTEETKSINGTTINTFGLGAGQVPNPLPAGAPFVNSLSQNAVNYKAGIEYDLAPQSMLFATVATGFKAGGFYPAPVPNSYKPEKLRAIEFGARNRFLNNRLQVNIEGFDWAYTDLQQTRLGYASNGAITPITLNAGRATLYGADLDVVFKPTSDDIISATVEYNHTRYDTFTFDTPTGRSISGVTTGCPVGPTHVGAGGLSVQTIDCSGYQLQRAPQWTASADYTHVFDLNSNGTLSFTASAAYLSSRYLSIDFLSFMKAPSNVTENASLTYAPERGNWSVTLWGKNLSNEAVYTAAVEYTFGRNLALSNIDPPRTFGATVSMHF